MTVLQAHSVFTESVNLVGGQRLEVTPKNEKEQTVTLLDVNGDATLAIDVTEEGPVLRLQGVALNIAADTINLHGRESVQISSDGDVSLQATGYMSSTARGHDVEATHGNCNVRANDDVKLNGERVMVNC